MTPNKSPIPTPIRSNPNFARIRHAPVFLPRCFHAKPDTGYRAATSTSYTTRYAKQLNPTRQICYRCPRRESSKFLQSLRNRVRYILVYIRHNP